MTAVLAGLALTLGVFLGRRAYASVPIAQELYAEHIRDALADLRRRVAGELPDFSLRDFIETGLFHPAHLLLTTRGRDRGDVRFSILHPDPDDPDTFVMSSEQEGVFPALGHSMDGRQNFSMRIDDSFSGLAYRTGRVHVSNDVQRDSRWTRHPRARPGRDYEAIVSIPLIWEGNVDGVFNVIATNAGAFESPDQTYLTLLGSVIDVARSIEGQ